jgi:glycosyltransferase involved in cell wall biosynthesis
LTTGKFSFLICTKNCEESICSVLQSISEQDAKDLIGDVIIVHYRSEDSAIARAEKFASQKGLRLLVIECDLPGKTPALIRGLETVSTEFCVIVDDDNLLFPDYVSNGSTLVEDEAVACFGAVGHFDDSLEKPVWFDKYENSYAIGLPKTAKDWAWGAGCLIRMSAWKELRAFDYDLFLNIERDASDKPIAMGGEDTELSLAFTLIGYKTRFSKKLNFVHAFGQRRLTETYLFFKTLGCFRAVPVTEIYRLARDYQSSTVAKSIWYFIIARSFGSNLCRCVVNFFLWNRLEANLHLKIAQGVLEGFVSFHHHFNDIYFELRRIVAQSAKN